MKCILEYNSFIDKIDLSEIETGTKSRSKPLSEDEFINLLNENCKNYNFENTQMYRGVYLKYDTDFFYIDNKMQRGKTDSNKKYISDSEYNKRLSEDPQFIDFPDRTRCIIGSTHPKGAMITTGNMHGEIQKDITFIMIPYDNVKIAVAPTLDIMGIKALPRYGGDEYNLNRNDFQLHNYTKKFKINDVPTKGFDFSNHKTIDAKEVWTEGPCLLVRYSSLEKLKELVEQRS